MKTRKSDENSVSKAKAKVKSKNRNKNNSLRSPAKVRPNVTSSERLCNRCKAHEIIASIKGHKCPYVDSKCNCIKCADYEARVGRKRELAKKRRIEKRAAKDRPKPETVSFADSLKAKSKKILNKKRVQKQINSTNDKNISRVVRTEDPNRDRDRDRNENDLQLVATEEMPAFEVHGNDNPPKLVAQHPIGGLIHHSSALAIAANSASDDENQTFRTSCNPSLCAQYLKACGELSRKLKTYQLSSDEMIACFKYSTIRDCLGDVEMAVQKIAYASKEIRMGAAFNIQNPSDESDLEPNPANNGPQTAQPPEPCTSNAPMLCSTFNVNFRSNNAINYSPAFTPIRHSRVEEQIH